MSEEKPPAWAQSLVDEMRKGFAGVDARLDGLETNLDIQGNSVKGLNDRMKRVEDRMDGYEDRQRTNSIRVQQTSEADMKHDAAIAGLVVKMDALDGKVTELLALGTKAEKGISKLMSNPTFRTLLLLAATAISGWLASHGGHVK